MSPSEAQKVLNEIRANVEKVVIGKSDVINLALICLICGGHTLIEDVPGLGKTTLASAIAKSIDCSFSRLQFTPDVLPSDITGFTMYDIHTNERQFYHGAVMTQILLADEINRTNPKTQSALLQAMQEGQISVDGNTYDLPKPFMVLATQNPVDLTGTYPLPEAQLDRFFMCISIGYPDKLNERLILERSRKKFGIETLKPVTNAEAVISIQGSLDKITCTELVTDYIVEISHQTRIHKDVRLGVSPRGAITLMHASIGHALISGRDYVLPDDVQHMLEPVFSHRIILRSQAQMQNKTIGNVLQEILHKVVVPATF